MGRYSLVEDSEAVAIPSGRYTLVDEDAGYDPMRVAIQSFNAANASSAPLQPAAPQVKNRGMLLPLTEYDDGSVKFDIDSGITAPIGAFVRAWNKVDSSKLPSEQPELIPDTTTAALGVPVDVGRAVAGAARTQRPTIGTTQGIANAQRRAADISADVEAFDRLGVRPFGPAFNQGPLASVAKQLSETPFIGATTRNAMDETLAQTAQAAETLAQNMGGARSFDEAGRTVTQGLERYRAAQLADLEPDLVRGLGANPSVQGPPRLVMSEGAVRVAREAAPIRQEIGATTTQTTRGANFGAGRETSLRDEFITRRTTAEDLTPLQLDAIVRAPADRTSFATRAEALYERAWRQIPELDRIDGRRNPNVVAAVNTRGALREIDNNIANQIAGQGTITGDLANRLRNAQAANFPLADLRSIRTEIGRALSNTNPLQATLNRGQLKRLYGAVTRDIEIGLETLANRAAIATRRGDNRPDRMRVEDARQAANALRSFRTADRYFRAGIGRVERVYGLLNANNPEQVTQRLISAATEGGKGNIGLLQTVRGALRDDEWSDFAGLVVQNLGHPKPSARDAAQEFEFSVQTALTNWNKMDPRARAMLTVNDDHARALNDLARVIARLANVEAQRNTSRSATNALNTGGVFAAGAAAFAGDGGLTLLGSAGSGVIASYLMSRPAYARWLATYANLRARALNSRLPVTPAIGQHIAKLYVMSKADPELRAIAAALAAENGLVEPSQEKEKDG